MNCFGGSGQDSFTFQPCQPYQLPARPPYLCPKKILTTYTYYNHYRLAVAVCFSFFVAISAFLLIHGKKDSFILINGTYTEGLDYFFQYVTYLGDGLMFIPIVVYCIFWNRKFLIPTLLAIFFCTLLSQGLKRTLFVEDLRPISLELEHVIIHKIEGVPLNRMHSFPSGHTSTAFTLALLLCSIQRNRIWCLVLPLVALVVGYSRIYLGQHFLTDVSAGVVIGIVSSYLALLIYHLYVKKKNDREIMKESEIPT